MRALPIVLLLAAVPAAAADPAGGPSAEPASATSPATSASTATAAAIPTPAVLAKLDQGDRLLASGDQRNALFSYLDAVYLQPSYAPARVKLGRAYLAMHYPARAQAQAEKALAIDAASVDARRLLEDCKNPPPRTAPAAPAAAPAPVGAADVAAPAQTQRASRVYRLPDAEPSAAAATPPSPSKARAAQRPPDGALDAVTDPRPAPALAGDRYRAAVELIARREYAKAIPELDAAVALSPDLAVAWSARGSARFGLGRHREAAEDYAMALRLRPELGTPLYGLAECFRLLGDPRAAELYRRYADSAAPDVRDELRAVAARRAAELERR